MEVNEVIASVVRELSRPRGQSDNGMDVAAVVVVVVVVVVDWNVDVGHLRVVPVVVAGVDAGVVAWRNAFVRPFGGAYRY